MFTISVADELKKLASDVRWQYFEKLVGWIFEQNDFSVEVNRVENFSGRRRQFDVIAERFGTIFLVECKKWSGRRYRTSLLKKAVKTHLEKCRMYEKAHGKKVIPILVTLVEEDIFSHENVPVVPIEKLNTFINHFEEWI